jgi:hypothetical protein
MLMDVCQQEEPPSVPYKVALRQKQECEGNNKEALGEQLEKSQQRATQIEQDREHWRHEFQLLQMKHTKEQQVNAFFIFFYFTSSPNFYLNL